jgi:hypothetical protein
MSGWNGKNTASVIGSGIIASVTAPGVVYAVERLAPHQMTWVKQQIADHIIYPQLGLFEALSSNLNKAHENYDKRKRAELEKRGEKLPQRVHYSPRQRAFNIADTLVQTGLALGGDFAATYGLMKLMNKAEGVKVHAGSTTFIDAYVTLGCLAVMPTLLAGFSENIHHGMRHMIQKITGMKPDSADKLALSGTYVGIPSIAGMLAGVIAARR